MNKLIINNEIPELRKISSFVEAIFDECCLERKKHILVRSGLDAALNNCVLYAYDSPGQKIEVTAESDGNTLTFVIKDRGKAFNPLEYRPKQYYELKPGGLGISMYRANFDNVQYRRENEYNILTLTKNL